MDNAERKNKRKSVNKPSACIHYMRSIENIMGVNIHAMLFIHLVCACCVSERGIEMKLKSICGRNANKYTVQFGVFVCSGACVCESCFDMMMMATNSTNNDDDDDFIFFFTRKWLGFAAARMKHISCHHNGVFHPSFFFLFHTNFSAISRSSECVYC